MHEKYKKFQCMNPKCDFAFWKIMGGRQIEPHEADALIKDREIGPLEGFRSKMGRPFSAKLKLNDANEVVFDFGNADALEEGESPDFSEKTPLGACPKCGSRVFELGNAYVCEKAVGPEKTCDFRSGPHDPPAADRAGADAEVAGVEEDRSPAVRVLAHAAAVFGLSGRAKGRQGRLRIRGQGPQQGARRPRRATLHGAARAGRAPPGQAAGRIAQRALRARTSSTAA